MIPVIASCHNDHRVGSLDIVIAAKLLALLLVVNGSPVVARAMLGSHLATPIDGGYRHRDGRPLLGPSKTWAGAATAMLSGAVLAPLLGLGATIGFLIGLLAMIGDAGSSFIKRRQGLSSGEMALGLDQLPEALLPLSVCIPLLDLDLFTVVVTAVAFMLANLAISRLLYAMGIEDHPH